ncbi:hypothetical protein [Spirillospora sp. NPDC048819]|uniref:hypothetical protein n=1 Tax=Spirillospora sp. NPDC048819 TaxID=3155268 RepID=UPI0033C3EB3F
MDDVPHTHDLEEKLAAVATRAELAALLRELHTRADSPSLRTLDTDSVKRGDPVRLTKSSVSDMLKGSRFPRKALLSAFVQACGAPASRLAPWTQAWERIATTEKIRPQTDTGTRPDVCVELARWVAEFDQPHTSSPEEILRGEGPAVSTNDLAALPSALGALRSSGVTAEVVTCFRAIHVPVGSASEFWAVLAADMTLHRGTAGHRRWLVKESGEILRRRNKPEHVAQLRLTWKVLFERFLTGGADDPAWPIEQMVADITAWAGGRANWFYQFMVWLLEVVPDDPELWTGIHRALRNYEADLPKEAPWELRLRVKKAQGLASRRIGPRRPASFAPAITPIPSGRLCPYEFKAMLFPLTIGEVAVLLADEVPDNVDHPYVIDLPKPPEKGTGTDLVNCLSRLIGACMRDDPDSEELWAIPTAPEWLALAGCEDTDHPWGQSPPTPERANLGYDELRGRHEVEPVGWREGGKSPHGVQDCCGNVHEIVEWRLDGTGRRDFRLAGGCFRTAPKWSSCRVFRPLIPRPYSRRNVGVRLIKYHISDTARREAALRDFLNEQGAVR